MTKKIETVTQLLNWIVREIGKAEPQAVGPWRHYVILHSLMKDLDLYRNAIDLTHTSNRLRWAPSEPDMRTSYGRLKEFLAECCDHPEIEEIGAVVHFVNTAICHAGLEQDIAVMDNRHQGHAHVIGSKGNIDIDVILPMLHVG